MNKNYSFNSSKEIKTGDSIRIITTNLINNFGSENCVFITVGLSGNKSLKPISLKYSQFVKAIGSTFKCGITVFGNGHNSIHAHMIGVFLPQAPKHAVDPFSLDYNAIKSSSQTPIPINRIRLLVKNAKSKAKFGRVFDVAPIRSIEAVGGYMRRNFLKFAEFRKYTDFFSGRKLKSFRLYRVPKSLVIKPNQFSRHTESASRYRQAMTGLAKAAGTPISDIVALEEATGLSFIDLRYVAFEICNSIPGLPKHFPAKVFNNALKDAGCNLYQFKN
jgi:hypothetical protein